MGLFKSTHHPAKTDPAEVALALSLPPPAPPRKSDYIETSDDALERGSHALAQYLRAQEERTGQLD